MSSNCQKHQSTGQKNREATHQHQPILVLCDILPDKMTSLMIIRAFGDDGGQNASVVLDFGG